MTREYRLVGWYRTAAPIPVRLMATAEGYAMVRRKGAGPFAVPLKAWDDAPPCDADGKPL